MLLVSHRPGPDRPVGGGRQTTLMHSSTGDTHAPAHPSRPAPRTRRHGLALGTTLATLANVAAKASASSRRPNSRLIQARPERSARSPPAYRRRWNRTAVYAWRWAATARTRYRELRTELDRSDRPSRQRAVVQDGCGEGALLAAEQRSQVLCARIEKAGPETEATLKDYGTLPAEEGRHGYGLHTVTPWGVFDTRLATSGMRR